jgi:hypothetical protein
MTEVGIVERKVVADMYRLSKKCEYFDPHKGNQAGPPPVLAGRNPAQSYGPPYREGPLLYFELREANDVGLFPCDSGRPSHDVWAFDLSALPICRSAVNRRLPCRRRNARPKSGQLEWRAADGERSAEPERGRDSAARCDFRSILSHLEALLSHKAVFTVESTLFRLIQNRRNKKLSHGALNSAIPLGAKNRKIRPKMTS